MVFAAALTGIQSASSELAVIGNNIANASTHGFKSSRTEFADIYTSSGGSNAIGAGVGVSSVSQKHSQGGIAFTNSNLDLAISGEGYFQVKDSTGITYTRAGSFGVDDLGKIVNSSGQALQGKLAGSDGVIGGSQVDLVLPSGSSAPSATKSINLGLNLDSRSTPPAITPFDSSDANSYNNTSSTTIYDSFGGAHVMQTYYVKDSTDNQWTANFELIANGTTSQLGGTPITFTDAGVFSGLGTAIPPATITSNKVNLIHDFPDGPADPANLSFTMDFNNVALGGTTQYGAEFSIQSSNQDGYSEGSLQNIEVSSKGVIIGRFSNGQTRDLAQVTTATFSNPAGLQPQGSTGWAESSSSGTPLPGTPGSGSLGTLTSSALEQSNVDLTAQLVALITSQRNFQANAQSIRTGDTVAQTIINLR